MLAFAFGCIVGPLIPHNPDTLTWALLLVAVLCVAGVGATLVYRLSAMV